MGPDAMIFVFWMLSFKTTFSLSTFTFIKRLFSSSSLSAIRVVSAYQNRRVQFPQALNPICKSLNLRLTLSPRQYLLVIWLLIIVRRYPLSGVPQTQKNKKQSVLGTPSGLFQETCPHLCFIWSETEETSTRMSPFKFPPPCSCIVPSTAHWYFWPISTVHHHSLTFM